MREAGSAAAAVQRLGPTVRDEALALAERVAHAMQRRGIVALEAGRDGYPASLAALEDAPPVLFALGDLSLLDRATVAVVGTREATPYGTRVTRRLAAGVADAGVTVVSGLARGIDAEAHRAALERPGRTIAVLGTGVDVPYPREHTALHEAIATRGVVVSEALPGAPAHPGSFPRRNRIVAALADVVLVTEAGTRSGALITAGIAAGLGRLHAAVPGPVDVPSFAGSNRLLRDGAQVVCDIADLIGLVHLTPRGRAIPRRGVPPASEAGPAVAPDEAAVLAVLRRGARLPDELLVATGLGPAALAAALATLAMRGLVEVDPGGTVRTAGGQASG